MKVGVSMFITAQAAHPADVGRRAEELGFESFWATDHPVFPVHYDTRYPFGGDGTIPDVYSQMADPFVGLALVAAATKTLNLGTGVVIAPERNPLIMAKQVATLDHFSGGRLMLGIGAGWLREESEIMGVDFDHKWGRARECVLAMKRLWTEDEAEYHGEYYDFPPVRSLPKPAQRPHPPILLGSHSQGRVFRRVVAWGDGWLPTRMAPRELAQGRATLDELAAEAGRDPRSISTTFYGVPHDRELIKEYEAAGADRVVCRIEGVPEKEALGELEQLARKVLY